MICENALVHEVSDEEFNRAKTVYSKMRKMLIYYYPQWEFGFVYDNANEHNLHSFVKKYPEHPMLLEKLGELKNNERKCVTTIKKDVAAQKTDFAVIFCSKKDGFCHVLSYTGPLTLCCSDGREREKRKN